MEAFLNQMVDWEVAEDRIQRIKHFVTMYPPSPPASPSYEQVLSDEDWLVLNQRVHRDPAKNDDKEKKVARGLIKVKRVEKRRIKAEAQEARQRVIDSEGEDDGYTGDDLISFEANDLA